MSTQRQLIIMVTVAVLAAAGGYSLARMLSGTDAPLVTQEQPPGPDALLDRERPDFSVKSMNGEMISAADFDGGVLLLNFWATWCKPCVEEMPMLSEVAKSHAGRGLRILGIAIDDPEKARKFAAELSLDYPIAIGAAENAVTGRRYGNRSGMLPYSVLIDRDGIVRWTLLGALEREELLRQINDLL